MTARAEVLPATTGTDVVDLAFSLRGRTVPADHGYLLYAAICRVLPEAHGVRWLGVHPLRGLSLPNGEMRLPDRATLTLRMPVGQIPTALRLAGKTLSLGDCPVQVGVPNVRALIPSQSLDSRLVAIKLTHPPHKAEGALDKEEMKVLFTAELRRQMDALGVQGDIQLGGKQQIKVGERRILGWSVRIVALSDQDSLLVQAHGLGGKRAMGCGVFVRTRG